MKRFSCLLIFAALLSIQTMLWAGVTLSGGPQWITPLPQGESLHAIAASPDQVVAVGDLGTIVSSTNGVDWTSLTVTNSPDLRAIAYGNGRWVAVGESGALFTSSDLRRWRQIELGIYSDFIGAEKGTSGFLIWTRNGLAFESDDATNWWFVEIPPDIKEMVFGFPNTLGMGNHLHIIRKVGTEPVETLSPYSAATFHGFRYYAIAPGIAAISQDGQTWQHFASPVTGSKLIALGDSLFAFSFENGNTYKSSDGKAYSLISTNLPNLLDVAVFQSKFIGIGRGGAIFTSMDGMEWTPRQTHLFAGAQSNPNEQTLNMFLDEEEHFYLNNKETILRSDDLNQWTEIGRAQDEFTFEDVAIGHGTFLALIRSNNLDLAVAISTNGREWRPVDLPQTPWAVESGNGVFVVSSLGGRISWSTNGTSWSEQILDPDLNFLSLSYGSGRFVATGYSSGPVGPNLEAFATSENGKDWVIQKYSAQEGSKIIGEPVPYQNGYFATGPQFGFSTESPNLFWTSEDFQVRQQLPYEGNVSQLRIWKDRLMVRSGNRVFASGSIVTLNLEQEPNGLALNIRGLTPGKYYTFGKSISINTRFFQDGFTATSNTHRIPITEPRSGEFFSLPSRINP